MRFFCLIAIFFISALIGYLIKKKYVRQFDILNELNNFIDYLYPNVSIYKNNLQEIINCYLIQQNNKNAKSGKMFLKNNTLYCFDIKKIKYEICDTNTINGIELFLNNIGKMDLVNECNKIKEFKTVLNEYIVNAKKELNEKGDLYFKISISIGLILSVVLW